MKKNKNLQSNCKSNDVKKSANTKSNMNKNATDKADTSSNYNEQ